MEKFKNDFGEAMGKLAEKLATSLKPAEMKNK